MVDVRRMFVGISSEFLDVHVCVHRSSMDSRRCSADSRRVFFGVLWFSLMFVGFFGLSLMFGGFSFASHWNSLIVIYVRIRLMILADVLWFLVGLFLGIPDCHGCPLVFS